MHENEYETVSEFCYPDDVLQQAGGCIDGVTVHILSSWMAFHDSLPAFSNIGISLLNHGIVFKTCVRSVLLHGSETWPMTTGDLSHIKTTVTMQ